MTTERIKELIKDAYKDVTSPQLIIQTPTEEYLDQFAEANNGSNDILLKHFAIQFGQKRALEWLLNAIKEEEKKES